jgi:hypothetical protein
VPLEEHWQRVAHGSDALGGDLGRRDPVGLAEPGKLDAHGRLGGWCEQLHGFRELIDHLGTLTRNKMRVATGEGVIFDLLATPTPTQRRVFELLGVPVPKNLV